MIKEWLARGFIIMGLVGALFIPAVIRKQGLQGIEMQRRMAETGGWTPENLTVAVGEPLHLHLTSDDVTHGFAVGQLDGPAIEIQPGETTDITLVFTKAGKYTFYCTRWCSLNHWRMRGTIEVRDPNAKSEPARSPLYVSLGLDIDANREASLTPSEMPSAWKGALLNRTIPAEYNNRSYYLSHTPVDLWLELRSETGLSDLSDQQVWNLVAWVWQSNTTNEQIQAGSELFAANCAACHGEAGSGNGIFADQLAGSSEHSN